MEQKENVPEREYINIKTGKKVWVTSTVTGGLWEEVQEKKEGKKKE